ncbi:MAG: alpha/beta fold hydrolase [Gammaproteobacteria bacterium]
MSAGQRLADTPEPMHWWHGADGIKLAGDYWGDSKGPLVVLQHGGGQTRHAWKNAGQALGKAGYYAIAFDARGHGDSQWSADGAYSQDIMVEDLRCILEQLGSPRPVLVGASMGGGTSLVAVGEDHIDATALVMVDIAPKIEPAGVENISNFMRNKPEGYDSLEEVAQAIGNYQPHRKPPKDLKGLAKNLRLADNGKYRWHWDPAFLSQPRDIIKRTTRLEKCAAALKLPTQLVRGGLSDILSEDGAQQFLLLCEHAEYVNITDAGHMVAGDRNDVFSDAVIDFLGRVVPVGGEPVQAPHEPHPRPRSADDDVLDIP